MRPSGETRGNRSTDDHRNRPTTRCGFPRPETPPAPRNPSRAFYQFRRPLPDADKGRRNWWGARECLRAVSVGLAIAQGKEFVGMCQRVVRVFLTGQHASDLPTAFLPGDLLDAGRGHSPGGILVDLDVGVGEGRDLR